MADTPNPAPAGAESAPARNPMDVLDMHWEGDPGQDPDASAEDAGDQQEDPEPAEIDPEPAPEGEDDVEIEGEGGDEEPSDDADEPEQKEGADAKDTKEEKFLVSRDGEKIPHSVAFAAIDKAREFERVLPQIRATLQGAEESKQRLAAEQQQFQATASGLAQWAIGKLPPAPDPALLDQNSGKWDPVLFIEQKQLREIAEADLNQHLQQVGHHHRQLTAKQEADRKAALDQSREKAIAQFVQGRPDLREPEKAQAFIQDRQTVAQHLGYSQQEITDIYDARLLAAIPLIAAGIRAQQSQTQEKVVKTQKQAIAAKKVVAAPPVASPAARQSAGLRDAQASRVSLERLRKTNSPRDAEDFLSRFV